MTVKLHLANTTGADSLCEHEYAFIIDGKPFRSHQFGTVLSFCFEIVTFPNWECLGILGNARIYHTTNINCFSKSHWVSRFVTLGVPCYKSSPSMRLWKKYFINFFKVSWRETKCNMKALMLHFDPLSVILMKQLCNFLKIVKKYHCILKHFPKFPKIPKLNRFWEILGNALITRDRFRQD